MQANKFYIENWTSKACPTKHKKNLNKKQFQTKKILTLFFPFKIKHIKGEEREREKKYFVAWNEFQKLF